MLQQKEIDSMTEVFTEMGLKPKADTPEHFKQWLEEFQKGAKPKVKRESTSEEGATAGGTTSQLLEKNPRLPIFSGDKKGDTNFDLWKYEVQCLLKENYCESVISQAIRRSLKGDAARIVMVLGPDANITDILSKFESVYGTIHSKATVLSKFYSARQQEEENVAAWGCRLEDLLNQARKEGLVQTAAVNDMLKNMFYEGLRPELKDTTAFIFDKTQNFDDLRHEIRIKEEEMIQRKKSRKTERTQAISTTEEIEEIKAMIQNLNKDVLDMKNRAYSTNENSDKDMSPQYSSPRFENYRGNIRGRGQFYRQGQFQGRQSAGDVTCYRCGQQGHLQYGCRVRLDHRRPQGLNMRRPTARRGK